jgi:hypothetical protein
MLRPTPDTAILFADNVFDPVRVKKPVVDKSRRAVRLLVVRVIVGLPDTPSGLEMVNPDPTAILRAATVVDDSRTKNPLVAKL